MPPRGAQVPVSKIVTFQGVNVDVEEGDGVRTILIIDPANGTLYRVPLPADPAVKIGQKLISGLHVAQAMPRGNGRA